MNPSTPWGVIFDMDGVLVDSAEPHLLSWQALAKENGGSVTREQFSETFGRQNNDIVPLLFGDVSAERLKILADRKEALYRKLVRDDTPIVPGAATLVMDLHTSGVRLAVGSSGPLANIELVLDAMSVRPCVTAIVSGDDVSRGKPDPEVFSRACAKLDLPPERCVVVEDAPAGVQAAKAAGTKAVAVLIHHLQDKFPTADLCVSRLAELNVETLRSILA